MFAGFWKRFFAFLIDCFILFVLTMIAYAILIVLSFFVLSSEYYSDIWLNGVSAFLYLFSFCLPIFYWTLFEASSWQATPGKMLLGIKVCDEQGKPLKFAQSLGRNLGKIVSNFTVYIGYAMAGFTVKRQALHDKMSGCLVIDKNAKFEDLRPFPKASAWRIAATIFAVLITFFLLTALLIVFIAMGVLYYINSVSAIDEGSKNLNNIKALQAVYKARNNVYAQGIEPLLLEDVSSDLELSKAKVQLLMPSKDEFSYNFMSNGVSAAHKKPPYYTLTVCYEGSRKCIDKDLTQFANMNFTVASPKECCGIIKEE